MKLRITAFKGQLPRVADALLDPSFASRAVDCALEDGTLRPLHLSSQVVIFANDTQSFVHFNDGWIAFADTVSAVPAPVADNRLYVADGVKPKMIAGDATYDLALQPPLDPPMLTLIGDLDPDLGQDVVYVYTYLTSLDEESAPSPLSYRLLWSPGCKVKLDNWSTPPGGRGITHRRIYRSQLSATGVTDLYFVDEVPVAGTSYTHDLTAKPMAEVLPTADFDEPPNAMKGLIAMPNGIMAAFRGKELLFSEPYIPHAWPSKYRRIIDYKIVGLAAFGTTIAVMTTGTPYIGQGSRPDDMVLEAVENGLPCVSAAGIADIGYAAIYPSNDGLVMMQASGAAKMVTRGIFSKKQWRALDPVTISGAGADGRYVFSHKPIGAAKRRMGVIDITGEVPFYIGSSDEASVVRYEPTLAETYVLDADKRSLRIWNDVSLGRRTANWRSKTFILPSPTSFGILFIETEQSAGAAAVDVPPSEEPPQSPSVVARVYAGGRLVAAVTRFDEPVRLPSGFLETHWTVDIETNVAIIAVTLAGSVAELGVP